MTNLQIRIDDGTADKITLENLKNIYMAFLKELEYELDDLNDFEDSPDIDGDIFETVQMCKSLEKVLSYYDESKNLTTSILKQKNFKKYDELFEKEKLQERYKDLVLKYENLKNEHVTLIKKIEKLLDSKTYKIS